MATTADPTALVAWLVRALQATRVLEIGTGDATRALQIADTLPPDGLLIAVEPDAARALQVREAFDLAGHSGKASVIAGDPARYLHKIAGPFDLILQDASIATAIATHERVSQLLRPGGTLITHTGRRSGGYNERLIADNRFHSVVLPIGEGVTISIRTANDVR